MATGLEVHGGYTENWAFPLDFDVDRDVHSSVDRDADHDLEGIHPVDMVVVHWDMEQVLDREDIVREGF